MINIGADEELRKLIREEIRGQVINLTRDQIEKEVAEGIRRARGAGNDDLIPLIERIAERMIAKRIDAWLAGWNPKDYAMDLTRRKIDAWIDANLTAQVLERAKRKLDDFDYKSLVEKALKNFKISL